MKDSWNYSSHDNLMRFMNVMREGRKVGSEEVLAMTPTEPTGRAERTDTLVSYGPYGCLWDLPATTTGPFEVRRVST